MAITLKDLVKSVKELPEERYQEAYQTLQKFIDEEKSKRESEPVKCVRCGSTIVVRNGKRHGKQAYICRGCGKTFVHTSKSAIQNSQATPTVWKQVIQDTVTGVSIDKTAKSLDLAHSTVFNMRHKILVCLEDECNEKGYKLDGVNEADETYVLDSMKGRKIEGSYYRGPRKHGAVAEARGISNEYICICTSVGEDNKCMAKSINRASPSKEELKQVFSESVNWDTVLLCDGNKNYDVLGDKCTVAHSNRVNNVNGFHRFIKDRLKNARGVATIYLNRYNALFAQAYGKLDETVEKVFQIMVSRTGRFQTIAAVKSQGLLDL